MWEILREVVEGHLCPGVDTPGYGNTARYAGFRDRLLNASLLDQFFSFVRLGLVGALGMQNYAHSNDCRMARARHTLRNV